MLGNRLVVAILSQGLMGGIASLVTPLSLCGRSWSVFKQVSPDEAEQRIRAANEPYKLEILQVR